MNLDVYVDPKNIEYLWNWIQRGAPEEDRKRGAMGMIRTATERIPGAGAYQSTVHVMSPAAFEIVKNNFPSEGTLKRGEYHQFCDKKLRHEHVVPCKFIHDWIPGAGFKNSDELYNFFERFGLRASITLDEDRMLRKQSMPQGWEHNPLARYEEAGIQLMPFPWRNRF